MFARVGEHGVLRTHAARQGQRRRGAVDGDHPGARRHGDLHSAESHPADSDDRDPFAGPNTRPGVQRPVGGGEPAAQCCGRGVVDDVGDRHQIGVGRVQADVFGEGTPVGETGLGLVRTDLRLTAATPFAGAAAAHERCGHAVADRPPPHVGAHRDHHPDEFVARHVRQRHPVVVACPGVPVAAAETRRVHLHDHTRRRGHRIGDGADIHRTAELVEHHRAHDPIVPCPQGP